MAAPAKRRRKVHSRYVYSLLIYSSMQSRIKSVDSITANNTIQEKLTKKIKYVDMDSSMRKIQPFAKLRALSSITQSMASVGQISLSLLTHSFLFYRSEVRQLEKA